LKDANILIARKEFFSTPVFGKLLFFECQECFFIFEHRKSYYSGLCLDSLLLVEKANETTIELRVENFYL